MLRPRDTRGRRCRHAANGTSGCGVAVHRRRLVARLWRRTSRRAGGITSANSSEARSCCIALKVIKAITRSCLERYSLQDSSGSGLPSALPKPFSGYGPSSCFPRLLWRLSPSPHVRGAQRYPCARSQVLRVPIFYGENTKILMGHLTFK